MFFFLSLAFCNDAENEVYTYGNKKTLGAKGDAAFEGFADRLDEYREFLKIPAMSAAVVQNGRIIFARGFGYADLRKKIPAGENTAYHVASLTKTFSAAIICKLIDEGKVNLEDPVRKYGIRLNKTVKIKHLLSHTSESSPGKYFSYNSSRFNLLGKIIQKASGKPYSRILTKEILNPLEMNSSAVNIADKNSFRGSRSLKRKIEKTLAKPYRINSRYKISGYNYPESFSPSAGLISTVIDLAKFSIAIDNNKLYSKEIRKKSFTPFISLSGDTLPYGYGWFVQYFKGLKLVWHYGDWRANSSLLLKIPEKGLSFILLANTDELSTPFAGLAVPGNVLYSIFATEFIKSFVSELNISGPEISLGAKGIEHYLAGRQNSKYYSLLTKNLISFAGMCRETGRLEKADSLMESLYRLNPADLKRYVGEYKLKKGRLVISKQNGMLKAEFHGLGRKYKNKIFSLYPENAKEFVTKGYHRFAFPSKGKVIVYRFDLPMAGELAQDK